MLKFLNRLVAKVRGKKKVADVKPVPHPRPATTTVTRGPVTSVSYDYHDHTLQNVLMYNAILSHGSHHQSAVVEEVKAAPAVAVAKEEATVSDAIGAAVGGFSSVEPSPSVSSSLDSGPSVASSSYSSSDYGSSSSTYDSSSSSYDSGSSSSFSSSD